MYFSWRDSGDSQESEVDYHGRLNCSELKPLIGNGRMEQNFGVVEGASDTGKRKWTDKVSTPAPKSINE